VEGKQCTIAWHVNDMKISHVNRNVVTDVIILLELEFGKMSMTHGKEHIFLGDDSDNTMTITWPA